MKLSLTSEVKTLLHSKLIYLCFLAVIVLCGGFAYSNYETANRSVQGLLEMYHERIASGTAVDAADFISPVLDIFSAYSPAMAINNAVGVLVGAGLLLLPVGFSLFVGNEYKKGTIKVKINRASLPKVILSKYLVTMVVLAGFLVIYCLLFYGVSVVLYNQYLASIDLPKAFSLTPVAFNLGECLSGVLVVYITLLFYISLCMLLSYVFKNSIAGVVTTLVVNFVSLPTKFSPHNIIFQLLNRFLYVSENSPVSFVSPYSFENETLPLLFLAIYFVVILAGMMVVSKTQRN